MPRTPSLRSLFLAWVCFSVAFSTVFQAFLTIILIDSGYKRPIQNMDVLFASGIKLAHTPEYNFIFENGEERSIKITKKSCEISNDSLSHSFGMDNAPRKCINFYIRFSC
jgi:hypothetical protein